MYLGLNIKHLRKRRGLTQQEAALKFGITRSTLNNYENTTVQNPTVQILSVISKFFNISIDLLLKINLTKFSNNQLENIEKGFDAYTTGANLRILTTTIDKKNIENNELVSIKASAGYSIGYGDVEFVKNLPIVQLPFLKNNRKYRTFQISGDSMYPIPDKSYVVGEFIEDFNDLKNNQAYIIVTIDDGIVFKIVTNQIKTNKKLVLSSLNVLYEPYQLEINKIKEAWAFKYYISSELPDNKMDNNLYNSTVLKLQKDANKFLEYDNGIKKNKTKK
jgi:transcriptional regulator with XRE-family HTH domain